MAGSRSWNAAACRTIATATATSSGPAASGGFMPKRSIATPMTRLVASIAPFITTNSRPISAGPARVATSSDGSTAPTSAITMPKTNIPAYAARLRRAMCLS